MTEPAPITIDFLAEQQARILAELGPIRDDLAVVLALLTRLDGTVSGVVSELRAVTRHRVERLEEKEQTT